MENDTYLPHFWTTITEEEKLKYHTDLGDRCQEHRYRYYALDNPVLDDFEYDYLERVYKAVSREMNLPDVAILMVDWDETKPGALQSKNRVDNGEDHYTINLNRMRGIWEKLGKPRYIRKGEAK